MSLPSGGHLRDRLDETAAGVGDLGERSSSPSRATPRPRWCLSTKMQVIRQRARGGGFFAYSRWCFYTEFLLDAVRTSPLGQVILVEDAAARARPARPAPPSECGDR